VHNRTCPGVFSAIAILAATTAMTAPAPVHASGIQQPARTGEAVAARDAGEPIMAIVALKSQRVTIYDANGWILRAPVSTGMTGRETPAGVFSIVEKDKDHHSNLYDDASMPNMERLTWSGIAMHGGPLPGFAASHGCVRMPYGFAQNLFNQTQIGMRVIIAPNDVEPVRFSHPALFVPSAAALADARTHSDTLALAAADAAEQASRAKSDAAIAARAAAALPASLRKLEALKIRADSALVFAEKALTAAKTEQATSRANDLRQKAAADAAERATLLETAKTDAMTKVAAAKAAGYAAAAAMAKLADTTKAAHDAKQALEPVSIFISRATKRLYVRHGFGASFDVPITIRDPDRPIGTHVFTALADADTGGLRWTAVTIDAGDSPKDALDRVAIPKEVLDRIAPTAMPRSSIVISDEPLNSETNYRTEFIVVLNNQPQGGLVTRQRPVDDRVADGDSWEDGSPGFGQWGNWDRGGGQNYYRRRW
jgi:hypothetical protein